MKYLLTILLMACTLLATAQDSTRTHDSKPWDYIMMKNGRMIEVTKGVQTPVTANIILINESTIHPDGTINASSGRTKHLKEGHYITMDGRIRKLKDLPAGLPPQ
jgi:hypothetical protein